MKARINVSRIIILIAVASALAITACSSSASNHSGTGESGATQQSTAASLTANVAEARRLVAQYETRPTTIGITQKIAGTAPANATIAVMDTGEPAGEQFNAYAQQAISVFGHGWKYVKVNQGATAQSVTAAWQQAVQMRPTAIIADGLDRSEIQTQCTELQTLGIPVIDLAVPNEDLGSCVKVIVWGATFWEDLGKVMADWLIADSNGTADVVVLGGQDFQILNSVGTGLESELARLCSKCRYANLEVQSADIGTEIPTQVVGYLESHPSVTYVAATLDDLLEGVSSALQSAGLNGIKIVGQNPRTSDQVEIASGGQEKAAIAFGSENLGYYVIDAAARYLAGDSSYKTVDYAPGPRPLLLTQSNVSSWGGKPSANWPLVANYQALYKALWQSS
jgi:ABC-type sugar transport system substrate-binding protein